MAIELEKLVSDFAAALRAADSLRPVATRSGGKGTFQPGIGPHAEDAMVRLCVEELVRIDAARYGQHARGVGYGGRGRSKCDLCFGAAPDWEWAVEAKLLRFLGDNGKPNGNMLMHILSPYAQDHSALTDCIKLAEGGLGRSRAIIIFGFEDTRWPLMPAIEAFELLARSRIELGRRCTASSGTLVHPVHREASVFGWQINRKA